MCSGCASRVFGDVSDHFGRLSEAFQFKSVHAPDRPLRGAEMTWRIKQQTCLCSDIACISAHEKNYIF
jgi:hypothetical protein